MKLSIASDHGGLELRAALVEQLKAAGHEVADYGPFDHARVDYPDYAQKACADVTEKRSDFAVLVCTTGVGMCMTANKLRGIRAYAAYNEDASRFTRMHNNANVICFGQKYHTPYMAMRMIEIFMNTAYEGGRHQARLDKISDIEKNQNR